MDKAYPHLNIEDKLYAQWEASGAMRADENSDKPPFTIPLPPPNVTGQLHLGHAAMLAIEDIMIRYKRMTGHEALWVPGTDHAAIATENVVIKHHEKTSREQWPSRESFLTDCRQFASEKHDTIVNQMKRMGAWLDWSREAYTFDEARNNAVNVIFKQLYEDGLIERGHRLINWSVGAQSVLSDDELEWEDVQEPFYYIRCGEFVIGTVRPETKCANSPLVVHPDSNYVKLQYGQETLIVIENLWNDPEKCFKTLNFLDPEAEYTVVETFKGVDLEGQKFTYPTYAGDREFYVIADAVIDPEKGAGAMTISASHSADDYDLAKRRGLDETFVEKIDLTGKMTEVAGPCQGMDVVEARKKSAQRMKAEGLLLGVDQQYQHRVPLCYRSGSVVEPMISPQWFVMVNKEFVDRHTGKTTTLCALTADAVKDSSVQIIPKRFEKGYFQWTDNLQDWCISRQIWWGHRIPVWYDEAGGIHLPEEKEIIFVRHGQSQGNAEGRVQGVDDPLTDKGIQHAKEVATALESEDVGVIVTGTSARNHQTAALISKHLGVEIVEIPELSSYDPKEVSGMTIDEIGRIAAIKYCRDNGKGEDFQAFVERLKAGLEKLQNVRTQGKIVFVTNRSIYSTLQTLRTGGNTDMIFEKRSKNSHLPHGIIDRWTVAQNPEGDNLRQDEDTLDTWFSSALWPFSTLGWPDKNPADLAKFYQTDVLETGWDILTFWVLRMIMFGRYAMGEYPFHTVYLHGMVTDEHGKKMSKSKGNGIDPLDMIDQFGTDPVRLALVIGSTPGNPIPIGENKIKGYRNFVNKLWNAARFVQLQVGKKSTLIPESQDLGIEPKSLADRWILSRLTTVSREVAQHLEKYEISSAGDKIYHFVWDEFCDWYLEASKADMNPAVLKFTLGEILKLTHPLCPFITETLWQELFETEGSLMHEAFPTLDRYDETAETDFAQVQSIVSGIRQLRADKGLNPKDKITAGGPVDHLETEAPVICALANLSAFTKAAAPEQAVKILAGGTEIWVDVPVDEAAEAARTEKAKSELINRIQNLKGRLASKAYTDKAPAHLVDQTRAELAEAEANLAKLA